MTDAPQATARLVDEAAGLEATFVPGAGMLCSSLRHHGEELLAQNAGVDAYAARGKTMGIPLLYPWANRLADFSYEVAGRTVEVPHDPARIALDENGLPIHGVIGGRMSWEFARAPGPDAQSLIAQLSWSESVPDLFEVFPFRHELRYEARLADAHLTIEVTVHACGEDVVPLAFGFHPYLSLPGVARQYWLVELPEMRHLMLDARQIPTGDGEAQAAEAFELEDREFDDGFDRVLEPTHFSVSVPGRRAEFHFLEGYPCAQVYAPGSGQFICFEPMTAPSNSLRSGSGLRLLAPGERYTAAFSVRVAD
jgi:aldose 1-epimerase